MSVLIKGMDMPKTCIMCWLSPICPIWVKEVSRYKGYDNRLPNCPLVEVPPHGRLIDADELETDTEWTECRDDYTAFSRAQINAAPTIIEAEEGEGDE